MTARPRLPVTALLGTNMFFSGVTYAATMPYASLVGVDTLGMSPGWFATVMAAGSILGTLVSLTLGISRTSCLTGDCWCWPPPWPESSLTA